MSDWIPRKQAATTPSDWLPHEIVTEEILFRLPVISLLKFRCVCKQWRTLIDSPDFIKRQILHSVSTTRNAVLFLLDQAYDGLYPVPYLAGLRPETSIRLTHRFPGIPPHVNYVHGATIFGSCNGLICLRYLHGDHVLILNPATRKHRITGPGASVPCHLTDFFSTFELDFGYGFGYDLSSDDYRVVRICREVREDGTKEGLRVVSFGVSSRCCRVAGFPYEVVPSWSDHHKLGVFVAGGLHWVVNKNKSDDSSNPNPKPIVVGYDLVTNKCHEVPLPEFGGESIFNLGELRGCLCAFENHLGKIVHVWMMKEYGVKGSWTKLFSVPNSVLCCNVNMVPLGLSVDGDEVLLNVDGKRLVWYNMEKQTGGDQITIHQWGERPMNAIVCYESLVHPDKISPPAEVKVGRHMEPGYEDEDRYDVRYDLDYEYHWLGGCDCGYDPDEGDMSGLDHGQERATLCAVSR
ncbi:F-box protein CPR1 [Linum grandiflorum]